MADITLDSVTKRFGEATAVDDLSLTVGDGEILGVVGPSGCGKTTTLRTIAGFETPTEGRVLFDDEDVTRVPPERRNVGLVFQSYALFENMTVRENVEFGPKMRGVSKAERRERAVELLKLLDIAELADRDPTTLSGGQQQRVGLARALAIEPTILLLDEPMTGLDAQLKTRLQRELVELLNDLDVTALYVTHDQTEAMAVCTRIAVMNDGRIEQVGTPAEVYEEPANGFVADFVGTSNRLPATARNGRLDFGHATTPAPNGDEGEVTVVARPEAFELGDGPFEATVRERFYLGEHVRCVADLPNEESVTLRVDPTDAPAAGERVALTLDTDRVHVLTNS
ncbi:ABC transporter ATP-binding protein [Halosimplex aquaticum]|uniref:Molybdate/tungstate import ATP-binding protein WtpC n=1 Tax=Halosimplex aquaticum TaxID=3026162 RepID=A0ABD5Y1N1_9EURY|nr:ABC transporter ATP-binding protein [Halosimplex aquaticum]